MNETQLLSLWIPACAGVTEWFFVIPAQAGIRIIAEARNLKAEFSLESQKVINSPPATDKE